MKSNPCLYGLATAVVLLVSACAREGDDTNREQILEQGRAVSGEFMKSLKGRLVEALAEGGAVGAIEVCHQDASVITEKAASKYPAIHALGRVSLRWRNPANQPDELDRATWRVFEETRRPEPEQPEDLLVPDPDRDNRVVYYRALRMAPLCLTCHGPAGSIPAEVTSLLAERYPDDRATGFAEGELRGLIRIDFDSERVVRSGDGT